MSSSCKARKTALVDTVRPINNMIQPNFRSGAAACSDQTTSQPQSPANLPVPAPVQPQVGEQWEEFLRYALELQRRIAQGGCAVVIKLLVARASQPCTCCLLDCCTVSQILESLFNLNPASKGRLSWMPLTRNKACLTGCLGARLLLLVGVRRIAVAAAMPALQDCKHAVHA